MDSFVKISKDVSEYLTVEAVFTGPMVDRHWHKLGNIVDNVAAEKIDQEMFSRTEEIKYENEAGSLFNSVSAFFFMLDTALTRTISTQHVRLSGVSFMFNHSGDIVVITHKR